MATLTTIVVESHRLWNKKAMNEENNYLTYSTIEGRTIKDEEFSAQLFVWIGCAGESRCSTSFSWGYVQIFVQQLWQEYHPTNAVLSHGDWSHLELSQLLGLELEEVVALKISRSLEQACDDLCLINT